MLKLLSLEFKLITSIQIELDFKIKSLSIIKILTCGKFKFQDMFFKEELLKFNRIKELPESTASICKSAPLRQESTLSTNKKQE